MELKEESKEKIIDCLEKYADIVVLTSKNNSQAWEAANSLVFSLRKLAKNATLLETEQAISSDINQENKENNSQQADFLISIKEGGAKLSNLFYEKTDTGLNLFLKTAGDDLKKEDIALKPLKTNVLLITVGIETCETIKMAFKEIPSFILNIGNQNTNRYFGDLNIIETQKPLTEIVFEIIKAQSEQILNKETSTANVFIERGEVALLKKALGNLKFCAKNNLLFSCLSHSDFLTSKATVKNIKFALEKMVNGLFSFQNFLLLWEQNSSPLSVWGVFYSPNHQTKVDKLANAFGGQQKCDSAIFNTKEKGFDIAQSKINEILNF